MLEDSHNLFAGLCSDICREKLHFNHFWNQRVNHLLPFICLFLIFAPVVFDYISKRLFEKYILFRGDSLAQNMARILLM